YKPVGQDVHSGSQKQGFALTLIDEIQNYLYAKGEYIPEQEQSFKPSLCNRIDRNTEGLVISAKNAVALRAMNEAIRLRQVHKQYLAVTAKPLPKSQDTCIAWLKKDTKHNHVTILDYQPDENWQKICTQYKIIAQHDQKQLVKINLLTGRTHQIRSHLAHLHAPLLGEKKYSPHSKTNTKSTGYQCLCAYQISFSGITSPELQYLEHIKITAPIPEFVKIYFPEIKKL
ncbi:MAG: RNA pseudouridine synthase, partial [Oscillospiraceae bacterium]|nr:RNA pseudouridine synthase [Oscillospiraceae bacterium]